MYFCPACVSATCARTCRCMQRATLSLASPPGIQALSHEELRSYSRQVWWTTWTLKSQSSRSFTCFLWLIRVRCAFEIAFPLCPWRHCYCGRLKSGVKEEFLPSGSLREIPIFSKSSENLKFHGLMRYTERIKNKNSGHYIVCKNVFPTYGIAGLFRGEWEVSTLPSCSGSVAVYCHGFLPSNCPCSLSSAISQ